MVLIPSILIVCVMILSLQVYAMSSLEKDTNVLENGLLHGKNSIVELDIQFGDDRIQKLAHREIVHPQITEMNLSFNGEKLSLTDIQVRVVGEGSIFRISSLPDGVLMFGYQISESQVYEVNIYLNTEEKLHKVNLMVNLTYPEL